jgi:MFS family permease
LTWIAYIIDDIGGQSNYAWLGIANSIAAAAVFPATGALSDMIGRRSIALCGAALIVIGMTIVGSSGRIEVAIGGMAIAGVGSAFSGLVGISGIAELVPVKSRGMYLGAAFLLVLPFGACSEYG